MHFKKKIGEKQKQEALYSVLLRKVRSRILLINEKEENIKQAIYLIYILLLS